MFFILLGIVLIVLLWLSAHFIDWEKDTLFTLFNVILVVAIILGIFIPVSGYKEPVAISETQLVSLTEDVVSTGGGLVYISIDASNAYKYRFEVDSKYATGDAKAYKSNVISDKSVTVVEDDSYTTAKLVVYEAKPKRTFWTFAVFVPAYEYVFYVPTGTVQGNITLD